MEKELSRVPRPLSATYNSPLIERLYESGGSVALDLIIYLANHQMKNLFGETWFSISDFCNTMNYDRTKLHRKLSAEQIKALFGKHAPQYMRTDVDGTEIVHPIETVFEAALYRLGKENLAFPVQNQDGSSSYVFVQILTKFDIKTDFKTKKGTKRLYSATLNQSIRESVFSQYNIIDLKDYKKIPDRTGYRYFYINLSKMICVIKHKIIKKESPVFLLTVNQLAKIFDINTERNDKRKTKVKEILDSINAYLTSTKFDYSFIKNGDKWAYTVEFNFPQDTLDYFDEKFKTVFTNRYHDELLWEYIGLAYPNLPIAGPSNGRRNKKEEIKSSPELYRPYVEWLHSNQDLILKENKYRDIFIEVFGKTPEDLGLSMFNMVDDFPYLKP